MVTGSLGIVGTELAEEDIAAMDARKLPRIGQRTDLLVRFDNDTDVLYMAKEGENLKQ